MNTPYIPAPATNRGHYLEIDGALGFVEDWGDIAAEPVLCIHTAGQSGVQYRRAAPQLAARGYRVIVPDLPGHGRSEPHPDGPVTSLGIYSQWLTRMLDNLGVDKINVVGCSIGGKITLDLAVRLGDRVFSAVSMAATADAGHVKLHALKRELEDVAAPSRSDRTYYGTLAVVGQSVSRGQRELIARMHCREDPQISQSDLIGWGNHDILNQLHTVTAPTYVVAGEDDLWISAEVVRNAAEHIPNGRYLQLPGIGHYPMEEMTDFGIQVDAWIRELKAAAPQAIAPEHRQSVMTQ